MTSNETRENNVGEMLSSEDFILCVMKVTETSIGVILCNLCLMFYKVSRLKKNDYSDRKE